MNALVQIRPGSAITPPAAGFELSGLSIFTAIPEHRHGIVAMRGMVVVYATDLIGREGIIEGAFYVRESQRPPSCLPWATWLREAVADEAQRRVVGPLSPLTIRREVVQTIRWPRHDDWAVRLESGWVDGPYHDWAFGHDLIGKVVGIYHPGAAGAA
jgi:hypothetical protein